MTLSFSLFFSTKPLYTGTTLKVSALRGMHCTLSHLSICTFATAGEQHGCWDHGDSSDAGIRTPTFNSCVKQEY